MNTETMNILGNIVGTLAGLVVLIGLGFLGWKMFNLWWQSRQQATNEETQQAQETMQSLAQILAKMETDANQASLLVYDAHQFTNRLVAICKALAMKAQSMRTEADTLQEAMDAISSQDILQIATSAGKVKDTHIRELMLCNVQTQGYWLDVSRLIAVELGTLGQWSTGYDKFASNLLTEVSGAKAKIAGMTASLELVGTARPLLQVQDNLNKAEGYLLTDKEPRLSYALKALPSVSGNSRPVAALMIDDNVFSELE